MREGGLYPRIRCVGRGFITLGHPDRRRPAISKRPGMNEPTPMTSVKGPDANGERPQPSAPAVGFAVIYRWRVHAELEAEFVAAWSTITAFLKSERGSLGARLHRGQDGIWYSYAQWLTAAARDAAFSLGGVDEGAMVTMNRAVAEFLPEILLSPVADQLGRA